MGGPVSRCTCHTQKTAQTQFTLPGGDRESETNFPGPADVQTGESKKSRGDRDVRDQRTERLRRAKLHLVCQPKYRKTLPQNLTRVGVAAHPASHPLQFINLAPFQSRRYPPFRESEGDEGHGGTNGGEEDGLGVCPSLHSCTDLRCSAVL